MVNIEPKPKGVQSSAVKPAVQRQPRGSKVGGRFAPEVTSEAEVELLEESVSLSDGSSTPSHEVQPVRLGGSVIYDSGSWMYPPSAQSVEQLVAFWKDVEIPDAGLNNIENADRDRDYFDAHDAHMKWLNAGNGLSKRLLKKDPARYAELEAEIKVRASTLRQIEFHQGLIPRTLLRDVVRIGGFYFQASDLGDDSRAHAYSTKFLLGTGEVTTAGDVVQKYRLWEISDAFFNRVRYSRPD